MTHAQRKLVLSWIIGAITLLITAYLLKTSDSYAWVIPMTIGMFVVRYIRSGIDNDTNTIFHFMSEKLKLFTAIYLLFLAGFVVYSILVKPEMVGNNVGIFMLLTLIPFILVAINIDVKLFKYLGKKNA